MAHPEIVRACHWSPDQQPKLLVVVDTEEEFDWNGTRSRNNTSVESLRQVSRFQEIADEYDIRPVYVVDYPIVACPAGCRPLQEIHSGGRCIVGTHLHPWVNPPFEESITAHNSFPGNLPYGLEAAKLETLTGIIAERFGARPTIYKAGRYGIGPNTTAILEEQGYEVDLSVCPHIDYSSEGGPDFTMNSAWPYWFGERRQLLELPLTVGFTGLFRNSGISFHRAVSQPALAPLHMVGVMARLKLVDRIWLSPEGYLSSEHLRLVRSLYRNGLRIFSFAFHSPSLEPGHTPYVRSDADLQRFLSRCRRFFDFFMGELGGSPTTPLELKAHLAQCTDDTQRE